MKGFKRPKNKFKEAPDNFLKLDSIKAPFEIKKVSNLRIYISTYKESETTKKINILFSKVFMLILEGRLEDALKLLSKLSGILVTSKYINKSNLSFYLNLFIRMEDLIKLKKNIEIQVEKEKLLKQKEELELILNKKNKSR